VLDSATRGAESSLDLTADVGGLVITARDVDGVGNDLDLIIKCAWSYMPVGIWINDHHGGFIKAPAGVYAPSIWTEGSFMVSANPPDSLQGALLLWHESYIYPSTQRCPGEGSTHPGVLERTDLDVPSRLLTEPRQTRGPPSPFITHAGLKVGATSF
jgi:hypothetical protein